MTEPYEKRSGSSGFAMGLAHIINVLTGSRAAAILKHGHDKVSTYAIGKDISAEQWKTILTQASTETVAMLNYDIAATPNTSSPKMRYGHVPVSLDQTKGDRSWVRTHFGLISVSSAVLTPGHS